MEFLELDVWLSSDGVPVMIHDTTVDRTTDGVGVVANMTLAELRQLDAGSWFSPAFAGEQIPTLEEAFQLVLGRGKLLLDFKGNYPNRYAIMAQVAMDVGFPFEDIYQFQRDGTAALFRDNFPGGKVVTIFWPPSRRPSGSVRSQVTTGS